jgi:uncharacterized RDD family membrane protein YckC
VNAEQPAEALLDTRTSIETPEHVVLSYHLAGPVRRGLAWLIDLMVRAAIVIGVVMVLGVASVFGPEFAEGLKGGLILLLLFLLEWGYFVGSEMLMSGRSIGKRALGLRVVSHHGLPVGLGDSLLRNLLRGADFLPFGYVLGVLCMVFDTRFRRLGDLVADTLVIHEGKAELKEPPRLSPPPSEAELQWLPAHVELSVAEREAIELFMRRASDLPPLRSDELADILAEALSRRLRLRYKHPTRFLGLLYHCHIQGAR